MNFLKQILLILTDLFLTSCIKTEVNVVEPTNDSTIVKSIDIKDFPKPLEPDTSRIPIIFNPIVEDWNDSTENNIN